MKNVMRQHGFTLIELIIFIAVISVLAASLFTVVNQVILTYAQPTQTTLAMQLAKARMELILGDRQQKGFDAFSDPCDRASPPAACNIPTGYTIYVSINNLTLHADPDFKQITVNVNGRATAHLASFVGDH